MIELEERDAARAEQLGMTLEQFLEYRQVLRADYRALTAPPRKPVTALPLIVQNRMRWFR